MNYKILIGILILALVVGYFVKPVSIDKLKSEMYQSVDVSNLSSLSLRLMVASQWDDQNEYESAKSSMLQLLQIQEPTDKQKIARIALRIDSFQAWMLGRMSIAALNINDLQSAQTFYEIISDFLIRPEIKQSTDPTTAWAAGYLLEYEARVNPEMYYAHIDGLLMRANLAIEKAKAEQALSTIAWIHIVNLNAAAHAKDETNYQQIKIALGNQDVVGDVIEDDKTIDQNILNVLKQIPLEDFRAWAYAWTLQASKIKHDVTLRQLLNLHAEVILNEVHESFTNAPTDKKESLRNDYVLGMSVWLNAKD